MCLDAINNIQTADSKATSAEIGTSRPENNILSIILRLLPPTVSDDGEQYTCYANNILETITVNTLSNGNFETTYVILVQFYS